MTEPTTTDQPNERRGIVRAASVLAIGNITSRILGLVRETVKASLFGATGLVDAYTIAAFIPETIFQLIVGGEMVNSALVPVFSDFADKENREELWRVVSAFLSIACLILAVFVIIVELFAPQAAMLTGAGELKDPALFNTTVKLLRIVAPASLFLSLASLLSGVLYSLKRFTMPAFMAAALNITIVTIALLTRSIEGLAWGFLLGSLVQVLLQLPALRDAKIRWLPDWNNPAIRRILKLYAPIAASIVINAYIVGFSYRLAAGLGDGEGNIAYMKFATTLYQFPLGLVAIALSVATLPTLSRQANGRLPQFRATLSEGLRLILTLILPATAGLFALAVPIVALVFERGAFTPEQTTFTATVLRWYLIGLPFAAVDTMLNFASYARKDTWRPALAGVISIGVYLITALLLVDRLQLLSLMAADAIKHITHVVIMLWFLQRSVGRLDFGNILRSGGKSFFAAIITGIVAYITATLLQPLFPSATLIPKLLLVALSGAVGIITYLIFIKLLRMEEAQSLITQFRNKGK